MDEGNMKRIGMVTAGTNTHMKTTRERSKGEDPGIGVSIT